MKTLSRTLLMTAVATCLAGGAYAEGTQTSRGDSEAYNSDMNSGSAIHMEAETMRSEQGIDLNTQQGNMQNQAGAQALTQLSSAHIMDVQESLKDEGYNVTVDGVMGQNTMEAIREFQNENGIGATGQLTTETLAALDVNVSGSAQGR